MKHLKKILAIFLIVLTIISMCSAAMPVFAENRLFAENNEIDEFDIPEDDYVEPEIISEITEKREENVKHFLLSDGSFMVAKYNNPVHYQNNDGIWIDIDNTMSKTIASAEQTELFGTDELYITNNAIENVVFAEKSNSNTLVSYEAKDYPISLNYQSAKKSKIKIIENDEDLVGNDSFLTLPNISQEVIYEDVFSGVDLQYIVGSNKIKENIIIKNKSAQNTFTVNYNIGELEAKVLDERTINLVAGENTVYTITAPYMYDANGTISNDITLNVNKNKNGKLRVVITADSEWLTDESRNYPIVIDPSIVEFSATELSSTYVSSASATENYNGNRDELHISNNDGTYGTSYALFELENIEKNIYADHIVSAKLKLPLNTTLSSSNRVYMYEITSAWDASTVNWNTKPSISNIKTDYCNLTTTSKSMSFDITKLYYQWTENENVNGVALKLNDTGMVSFRAEDDENPILILKYISTVGVDEDFSYTEFDMGSAGYVYVNNLSGNLVLTRDEFDTTGENYSYDFTKTYNSLGCVADSESIWINSYDSTIYLGIAYLDTDGSAEILTSSKSETNDSVFIFADNEFGWEKFQIIDYLQLPIPVFNNKIPKTLDAWCNNGTNRYRFNMGGLIEQTVLENGVEKVVFSREESKNADGTNNSNKFYLVDGDGDKIEVSITDTSVTYTQYDYKDANNYIIGDVLVYYKDSNGNITQIKLNEKVQANFTYDTFNRMTSVENDVGYKLTFSYEGEGKKITAITESKDDENGQHISFARTYNSMKARSAGSDGIYGNEDDLITTYKFNNEAKLLSIQNATVAGEDLGASMYDYDNNTAETDEDTETDTVGGLGELTQVSSIGKNVENLLKNHNLESLDSWQSRYAAGTGSEYTAVTTSSKHLYGANSFKLSVDDLNGNAAIAFTQEFSASSGVLVPGKTYTLSAYVNANGLSRDNNVSASNGFGAAVMFEVTSTSGQKTRTYSRSIQSTNSQVNGGWERVFLNITIPDTYSTISANLVLRNATGTVYFDAAQLEIGDIPNQYNLIENNGFNYTNSNGYATNWTRYNLESSDTVVNGKMKIIGNPDNKKAVYQDIVIGDSSQNENYVYGGWVTANAVPKKTGRHVAIYPIVYYKDASGNESRESKKFTYFDFYDLEEQYASGTVSLAHSTDDTLIPFKIRILVCYYRECNTAIFDKICLYRSNDVYDLTDEDEKYDCVYNNGNLMSYKDANDTLYEYTYRKLADNSYIIKTESITKTKNINNGQTTECLVYEYNTSGDLIKETITEMKTVNGVQTTEVTIYEYNTDGVLIKETTPDNKVYNYTYDNDGNLLSRLTASGIGDRYTYNANGDILTEDYEDGTSYTYTYDSLDNLLTKVDSEGKTNTYTYVYYDINHDGINDKSAIATESLEDGTVNTYTYSDYNKLTRQTTTKDGKTLAYNYNSEGNLTKVEHNGFEYKYEYDAFGNTTSVKVGDQSLINYTYQADKSKVSSEIYGNGSQINYTYTPYGQVQVKNSVGLGAVTTKYDALGNIIYENDEPAGTKTYYEYDAEGRLAGETVTSSSVGITGNNFLYSSFDVFDSDGNITNNTIKTQHTFTTNYTFANNLPSQTKMTSTRKVDFTYDEHDKLLTRTLTTNVPVVEHFAYNDEDLVSTHTFTHGTDADIVYSYSYDDNGNITEIKKNNIVQQSYVYDANSQLIRENNLDLNKTIVYTYDNGGNIVSKKEYAYTIGAPTTLTDTINYSYDSTWKDKLTSYDGQGITYDAIGNPTNYMGATMTWFARQMQSYSKGNTNITYKYDSDGLRTQKVVNGVEHNYYYVGDQLRYERYGDSYEIYYNYDVDGRPCRAYKKDLIAGKNYSYYLITNTRGDVIETRDGDGNVNAKFVYDSWGKLISVTDGSGNALSMDSFAYQISLKYRGYVYDSETGFYYLQSRYYDPETGRFLNADDVNYHGMSGSVLSYNAFAYCENNAVNDSDPSGTSKYKITAVGVQFEMSACFVSFGGAVGVEAIVNLSNGKIYLYTYYDAGAGSGYTNKAFKYFKASFKDIVSSPKVSLKNIANMFKLNWSITAGFFVVKTKGTFSWPNSYANGTSNSHSISIGPAKGYYSTATNCKAYGICYSIKGNSCLAISSAVVKYKLLSSDMYGDIKKSLNQLAKWIKNNSSNIKKAVGN